ncbi:MAG: alpha/beta hydrolase [Candidatus Thorarchaeota archaeon]
MVSKQMKYVIKGLFYTRSLEIKKRVNEHRKALEMLAVGVELPEDVECVNVNINDLSGIWCKTQVSENDRVILFFHGGAYIAGSADISKYHSIYISRVSNAELLSVNYRLAPEHPYPAALDDAVKAYRWLVEEKEFLPKRIVIVGVSAGGGLTIATMLKLRELGIELPVAAVCISPWADLAFTGETFRSRAKLDPFTTPDGLEFDANLYIGNENAKNPFISPVYADLYGLPPLYIMAGTAEILHDDAVRLAERAAKAGVDVTLDIWEDMIHGFPVFAKVAPESRDAIEKIGEFVRKHLK